MSLMYDKQEFFKSYFSRASEKKLFVEEFEKRFKTNTSNKLNILDLGCHDGTLLLNILKKIKFKLPNKISITATDPSAPSIEAFKKQLIPEKILIDLHVCTAEDYFLKSNKIFDWIIASHCLYWSKDLQKTIDCICAQSKSAVIVLRGKKGIFEIQSKFTHLLGDEHEQRYTSENIETCLKQNGVKFLKEDHKTLISIPDYNSDEFKWIISFFLQTTDDQIKANDWESIISFLKPFGQHYTHEVSYFWINGAF